MTMAAPNLPPPRKKTRVKEVPGAALPIPSALPNPPCTHYQATYYLGHITIRDPRQAEALWHNGYFGHGYEAGGGGRPRRQKKWRLVEADGLKSGKWFKEAQEASRRRRGVEGNADKMKYERKEKMEDADKEEMEEEEEMMKIENDGTEEGEQLKQKEKMEGGEALINMEKDRRSVKEEEMKREENGNKSTKENEEVGDGEYTEIRKGTLEESDEDYMNNDEEELGMRSDSDDSEPWRTVLELSGDQQASTHTHDPHTYLTLLPEEALFLSYALGCLVLTYVDPPTSRRAGKRALQEEQDSHEMTIDEMWRVFTQDDLAFPVKYAVYHHFRTQGWVVKGGLKYGVDYVLYPVGPPFYHSQYAVKVHTIWADTLTMDHTLPGHEMTWTTTATTERLSNHINKTPLICFVLRPRSLTQSRLGLIDCLKELKVQEMVLGRWRPSDGSG